LAGAVVGWRAMAEWLGEEAPPYVDLIESRFLVMALVGAALLGALAAPYATSRPFFWALAQARRQSGYRFVSGAFGGVLGALLGAALAWSLPPIEPGSGWEWAPFALSVGLALIGAIALGGRPTVARHALRRWTTLPSPAPPRPSSSRSTSRPSPTAPALPFTLAARRKR
ncbi:MAG: hypothetical protein NZ518_02015, partial [Dehalococcoidia bacterium]|nr:hypothetical protein [Dehalococcoidia bacterium]